MFEREQIVACGDAGAAVADDVFRWRPAQCSAELRSQFFGRAKSAGAAEVLLKEMICGAGDVAGHFVQWLGLAPEALRRAGVEQLRRVRDIRAGQRGNG